MPSPVRRSPTAIPPAHASALQMLLADRLGLDTGAVAPSFLGDVIQRAVHALGATDLAQFLRDAESGGPVWQVLADQAVVAETWFFRDEGPFEHVVNTVRERWAFGRGHATRILSCPCSTGEEPYSIAMALLDAGLPPEAARIEAADVSATAIDAARAAVYRPRSFRGVPADLRDRHFDHVPAQRAWSLKAEMRARVQFACANLVTGDGLSGRDAYDIVLCRNLLIYMHAGARARVFATFNRLLAAGGVLLVGHAEPGLAREHGWVSVGTAGAFAFARPAAARPAAAPRTDPGARPPVGSRQASRRSDVGVPRAAHVQPVERFPARATGLDAKPAVASKPAAAEPGPVELAYASTDLERAALERIRQMGDQGRLGAAVAACRAYLASTPGSAGGYFLLGVLLGAGGDASAAESAFRRAVYLKPDHADALVHLALSEEAKGATASAARLRARAAALVRAEDEAAR
ncbi:MAG: CheR family methyltransferase [Vicinamibacterales bacterium]